MCKIPVNNVAPMFKKGSAAPQFSIVPDEKSVTSSSEFFLEDHLEFYLKTIPENQQKILRSTPVRESVLRKLEDLKALIPLLERISQVSREEAKRLEIEDLVSFGTIINDRIASACQMAVLESQNQILSVENEMLREKVKIDPLTNLSNRRGYEEEAMKVLELAKRTRLPLWCFMLDIDDFRHVNNDYGHLAGDQVLEEVGRRLKNQMRSSDIIARFGGEEFISILFADEEGANKAASRVLEVICNQPFVVKTKLGLKQLRVTVSIGGSRFIVEKESRKTEMEERADKNLYLAKNAGKNQAYLDHTTILNHSTRR